MEITIKKASIEDASKISYLGKTTFSETFGHLFPIQHELNDYLEATFAAEKIASSLAKGNNVFWLAFADDLPVGYAKLKKYSPLENFDNQSTSQLQKIYVLKDFLDKKIGILLFQAVEEEITTLQKKHLWLVVLHTNFRAIHFYEKNGFHKHKKHFFMIGTQNFEFEVMLKSKD